MLKRIKSILNYVFSDPEKNAYELDSYLESKHITTTAELEYWMKEYDLRKRMYSRLLSEGKITEARWAMHL